VEWVRSPSEQDKSWDTGESVSAEWVRSPLEQDEDWGASIREEVLIAGGLGSVG